MNRPVNVLLVEDNPGDADLTRDTLGSTVVLTVAIDGVDALAILTREPPHDDVVEPDLILLDLNLPRMDGRELLAAIKASASLRNIPVVVFTSSDAERDVLRSYELGANCYVTKPLGLAEFQAAVRSVEHFWLDTAVLP